MAALAPIWGFLKGVPREVYYILLALLVVFVAYHKGASDENAEWEARMAVAVAEQKRKAAEARAAANTESQHRAEEHEEKSAKLQKVIEDAQASKSNPIDALIGSLSETD